MRLRLGLVAALIGFPAISTTAATAAGAFELRHGSAPPITFRGNGGKTLAPFRIRTPSTLFWAANGDIFQIFNQSSQPGGDVNSQAHRGATYMPPGAYRLSVNALGDWVIKIVPGIERPISMPGGRVGFRGNGGRTLPPFTTRPGTQLYWTSSGEIFQIFSSDYSGGGDVNSQAHRGTTYLSAGRHNLSVNALGSWTIAWRP